MGDRTRTTDPATSSLPPGQKPIARILRWGIDHPALVKDIPALDVTTWQLVVDGQVETPLRLGWLELLALPQVTSVSDFHCVEGWSVLNCRWEGVRFNTVATRAKPQAGVTSVFFECADGYTTSLPLSNLMDDDVLLAYRLNGEDLTTSLGGPLRLIVPQKYAYKSAMWLTRIQFLTTQRLGFWEQRGYSDTADVWTNDRFRR